MREGELVAGKYRIGHVLGVGGMGIVVAARHEQLDQPVAIKFVRGDALGNWDAVERFLREARAAAKLRSEHAARVLDVGTLESGAPYMVMELLEGSDLGQVLEQRGPLHAELVTDWVIQACEAVAEAHAAGIVHRDLKPQNLFLALTVGGAAKIKVLDFGVAKSMLPLTGVAGALTRTRATLGSPLYMAPEQMRSSRDVDARADVWALGVVIFELLTRRSPFEAETIPELCLKVVTDAPLSLEDLRPDVAKGLVDVVERCLSKDRTKRFSNAAELASALEPFAAPGAGAIVARARMAMASAGSPTPPERAGPAATAIPERPLAEPRGRMVPTPAAWGSGRADAVRGRRLKRSKRSPHFWIGVALASMAAAGAAIASALLVHNSARSVLPTLPSPMTDTRPAASSGVVAPTSGPDPARTTSPPTGAPPPASTNTPQANTDRPVQLAIPAESVSTGREPETPTAPLAAPSAKPAISSPVSRPSSLAKPPARDDDIPSLR